jgi:4-hydroxythreonine-4-phosphate dehydrogenase
MTQPLPLIAVTLGDPAGIGPELAVRVLAAAPERGRRFAAVVLGDPEVARENIARAGLPLAVRAVDSIQDVRHAPAVLDVLPPAGEHLSEIPWGRVDAGAGRAALAALELAAELVRDGHVDAVLSAPVNKQALALAGMTRTDELAFFSERTGSSDSLLLGVLPGLLTACVSMHVPLRDVPDMVTRARVGSTIAGLAAVLGQSDAAPRIVVAGLNPHAGDGGLLGREEIEEIAPAVAHARSQGIDAIGPVAPDTAFPHARATGANGIVCMYHDQANIARKLAGFQGATLFAGLSVPVATTAHGTAFEIAGAGVADLSSMSMALDQLISLATTEHGGRRA